MTPDENKIFDALIRYAEKRTCLHEDTYRGGAIWEICSDCGMKWADDEGGKPKNTGSYPKEIEDARTLLHSQREQPFVDNTVPNKKISLSYLQAQLKKKHDELAKVRDDIRVLCCEAESYLESAEEATSCINDAIDRLSEMV